MTDEIRISIVDDDASVRRALERLCRSAGFAVDAYDSAEAFLSDSEEFPACLVLDVNLPGRSGIQLQAELVASKRKFPIIFMTAFEDDSVRKIAIEAGAIDFLIKPLDSDRLLGVIKSAMA